MSIPPAVSPNVVIMTREELRQRESAAFKRGVERGRFEESYERTNGKPIPRPLDNGAFPEGQSIATESELGSAAAPQIQ